ncbi:hypothetical protein CPLU01_04474 [Colletotrichum plurivorum]|uniref:Uncharacterized protein n=1 Tax=Colletotrichum plurivorum TaxID=2175906 RepID=A0A8H6KPD1_9PEZI|nr:hypothetical protein CPLU01_04474 [Colletotrichum plurivorum]
MSELEKLDTTVILYPAGPPYQPQVAVLGLIPTVRVDVPICIILIIFFLAGAALNLFVFVRNKSCGHKFLPSTVLVGFCTTRIIALSLRIAWAKQPWNVKLDIAATVFAAAGVVLLFILNLIFTHRLLRALHPNIGWNPLVGYFFLFLYAYILVCLLCAVTATVVAFYTLVWDYLYKCRLVQLFASTSLAVLAFVPIPVLLGALFYPGLRRPEPFGYGSISTKAMLVLATAFLLTVGAAYRCAVNYAVRPAWAPGWWHHKACYYVFNYDLELVVVFTYALMRFDMRFHVPDGACKPGDYIKGQHKYQRVSSLAIGFNHGHHHHHHGHRHHGHHRRDHCRELSVEEEGFSSRSSRSGVIRGLSEIGTVREVREIRETRAERVSAYLSSSYDSYDSYGSTAYGSGSGTRSSDSVEIVATDGRMSDWEKLSRGRSTRRSRSRSRRGSGHHHHHHHHKRDHHGRRRSRDRSRERRK